MKSLLPFRIYEAVAFGDLFVIIFFVPFLLAKGLSMTEILSLNAIFSTMSLVFELPSGYLADKWQRRYVLFLSALIRAGAYALMWFGGGFGVLALAWGIAGIGSSFHSGTNSAFLYDTLKEKGKEKRYPYEWGLIKALGYYVFVGASLLGGFALMLNSSSPPLLNFIFFAGISFLPLLMSEPARHPKKTQQTSGVISLLRAPFRTHKDLLRILLFGAVFAVLGQISIFLVQGYLHALGFAGAIFGALMAIDYLARGAISQQTHNILAKLPMRGVLLLLAIMLAVGALMPALSVTALLVAFFLFVSFARGLYSVAIDTFTNERIASEFRATFLSGSSTAYLILYILAAPLFGLITDSFGIQVSLATLGCASLVSIVILIPLFSDARKKSTQTSYEVSQKN